MGSTIKLGDVELDLVQKDIKNIHLSVHPPTGRVTVSAPLHMKPDTIRVFALSKLGWIKKQQKKFREQQRETPREMVDRESHFVWGKRYLMKVIEEQAPPGITIGPSWLQLHAKPGTEPERRRKILEDWYRERIKERIHEIIDKWEPRIGVKVERIYVQRMKTKWGSCNAKARSIRINLELAKKPPECLEYIVVHEMVHILEPTHNKRFIALMDDLMPNWKLHRDFLNQLPVAHEKWR